MFRQAMQMLAADDETETLLLVSKPPAPEVVASLAGDLPEGKRVVAAFVGWEGGGEAPFEIHDTLEAAARAAAGTDPEDLSELERPSTRRASAPPAGACSACSPAARWRTRRSRCSSPSSARWRATSAHGPDERNGGHAVLDLGEEEYTQGRPHPMVDLDVRIGFLEDGGQDENVGCVLLDVVLGHGGAQRPRVGPVGRDRRRREERGRARARLRTDGDPQDAARQTEILRDAGAIVAPSNAAATRLALRAIAPAEVAA